MNELSFSMVHDSNANTQTNINIPQRKIHTWVNDNTITECYSCRLNFNIFKRKHHCRYCGQIF